MPRHDTGAPAALHTLALQNVSSAELRATRPGRREEGLETLREAAERSERSLMALAYLARGHAMVGDREEALRLLGEVEERAQDEYVSPSFIAAVHAELGDTAAALDCLERAYEKRDMELAFLRVHPDFDSLKSEARFIRLVEKIGLATPLSGAGSE